MVYSTSVKWVDGWMDGWVDYGWIDGEVEEDREEKVNK